MTNFDQTQSMLKEKQTTAGKRRTLFLYELRNVFGNWYVLFFGILFPIAMAILISQTALRGVPEAFRQSAVTGIVLSFAQVIPMAGIFLGHTALYSKELEERIPLRMQLFGFSQRSILLAKLQSQIMFQTIALALHFGILYPILGYALPTLSGGLGYLSVLYVLAIVYFVFAHGIANLFRKFGPAYGVSMGLYFAFMILGGMMGIPTDMMPAPVRAISNLLPFTHLSKPGVAQFWAGGSYNAAPLVQSIVFFGALACAVLFGSFLYRRNRAY